VAQEGAIDPASIHSIDSMLSVDENGGHRDGAQHDELPPLLLVLAGKQHASASMDSYRVTALGDAGRQLCRRAFGRWAEHWRAESQWRRVFGSPSLTNAAAALPPPSAGSPDRLPAAEASGGPPRAAATAAASMLAYGSDGPRRAAGPQSPGSPVLVGGVPVSSGSPGYQSPLVSVLDEQIAREQAATIAAAGEAAPPPLLTAVVTGGTSGVGREVVRGLRQAGMAVIIVARDGERGRAVCEEERIGDQDPDPLCLCVECDLSSIVSVQECAEAIKLKVPRVHVLVNCAGIVGPTERCLTAEGHEVTFATNVLGPHLLTTELLAILEGPYEDKNPGRVINATCEYAGGLNVDDLNCATDEPAPWSARRAYRASRQAVFVLSWALDRRLRQRFSRVSVNTFTPGPCDTPLFAALQATAAPAAVNQRGPCAPASVGAETAVMLATRNNGRAIPSGSYYRNGERHQKLSPELKDASGSFGNALWDAVEGLIGVVSRVQPVAHIQRLSIGRHCNNEALLTCARARGRARGCTCLTACCCQVLEQTAAERRAANLAEAQAQREAEEAAALAAIEVEEAARAAATDIVAETFHKFDGDGGGTISRKELRAAMSSLGVELSKRGMKQLMKRFDEDDR
jgi:retinol dehydrogenase-12